MSTLYLGTKYADFQEKLFSDISGRKFQQLYCSNVTYNTKSRIYIETTVCYHFHNCWCCFCISYSITLIIVLINKQISRNIQCDCQLVEQHHTKTLIAKEVIDWEMISSGLQKLYFLHFLRCLLQKGIRIYCYLN